MNKWVFILALFILAIPLSGCFNPGIVAPFLVEVSPPSGVAPIHATITATPKGTGIYYFEVFVCDACVAENEPERLNVKGCICNPDEPITDENPCQNPRLVMAWSQTSNKATKTFTEFPCYVTVTWQGGDETEQATSSVIRITSTPPIIHWPRVNGIDPHYNGLWLQVLARSLFDFNFYQADPNFAGDVQPKFGIEVPAGTGYTITSVTATWIDDGDVERDVTVYVPPYLPGVYHASKTLGSRDVIENAFVLYPPYLGTFHAKSGMVRCPTPEWTYYFAHCEKETIDLPNSQPGLLILHVEVRTDGCAVATRDFEFRVGATGCSL